MRHVDYTETTIETFTESMVLDGTITPETPIDLIDLAAQYGVMLKPDTVDWRYWLPLPNDVHVTRSGCHVGLWTTAVRLERAHQIPAGRVPHAGQYTAGMEQDAGCTWNGWFATGMGPGLQRWITDEPHAPDRMR